MSIKIWKCILYAALLSVKCILLGISGVTNDVRSGGRFGDKLFIYYRAKWISYRYGLPLYFQPFEHTNELALNNAEKRLSPRILKRYHNKHLIKKNRLPLGVDPDADILYIVNYYANVDVDWHDTEFIDELKKCLKPKKKLEYFLPSDRISIAIHVRRGGGYKLDDEAEKIRCATRFAPDSFYVESLKTIITMLPEEKFYIYIFTDEQEPESVVDIFKKEKLDADIIYDYRKENNHHTKNVIEDFHFMTLFDCFIHPNSSFSTCAAKLGNYKIRIFPKNLKSYEWKNGVLRITDVTIEGSCFK